MTFFLETLKLANLDHMNILSMLFESRDKFYFEISFF